MDWRVIVFLLPIILAASWAVYNILPAALNQFQTWWNKQT